MLTDVSAFVCGRQKDVLQEYSKQNEQGKAENLACALSEHVVALIASYSASVI